MTLATPVAAKVYKMGLSPFGARPLFCGNRIPFTWGNYPDRALLMSLKLLFKGLNPGKKPVSFIRFRDGGSLNWKHTTCYIMH